MEFSLLQVNRLPVPLKWYDCRTCSPSGRTPSFRCPASLPQPVYNLVLIIASGDGQIGCEVPNTWWWHRWPDEACSSWGRSQLPCRGVAPICKVAHEAAVIAIAAPDRVVDSGCTSLYSGEAVGS